MNVKISCNIDLYRQHEIFPKDYLFLPRVGEKIMVRKEYFNYCEINSIPKVLSIVEIVHSENGVSIEIYPTKEQLKAYKGFKC